MDIEVEPGGELTAATTVAEWRAVCDLRGTEALGPMLNQLCGVEFTPVQWWETLEPEGERTLGDLARAVARHGLRAANA
ncbi:MAG: hypothetical protein ACJ79S_12030 [Gemmatimonadaceae bacterium]